MEIKKQSDGSKLTVSLSGRLDTTTAPVFEKELKESLNGVSDLTLDFSGLEYISSAGLRVLLSAQKLLNAAGGKMKVAGANEIVKEIFDVTGFSDILTIE
ncbi:MAG: STAS domain-containing protein [Anaerolineaceae bacterium]|nr:STAS domain-containing protein [Anaerolineaceae bacterium]